MALLEAGRTVSLLVFWCYIISVFILRLSFVAMVAVCWPACVTFSLNRLLVWQALGSCTVWGFCFDKSGRGEYTISIMSLIFINVVMEWSLCCCFFFADVNLGLYSLDLGILFCTCAHREAVRYVPHPCATAISLPCVGLGTHSKSTFLCCKHRIVRVCNPYSRPCRGAM